MKKPFKIFGLGALTALVLVVCMGQQIDIHNPAGQGLARIQAPYMSQLGQQIVTNGDSYHLASMIFGSTNLPGGLLTNGTPNAYLPGGQFGETNNPATLWASYVNTWPDNLDPFQNNPLGSNGMDISISDGQKINLVNAIGGSGGVVEIANGGGNFSWQGGNGGTVNIALPGIGLFSDGSFGTVNVGNLNVEGTTTVGNMQVNGTASGTFTGNGSGLTGINAGVSSNAVNSFNLGNFPAANYAGFTPLQSAIQELKNAGVFSNLVDFAAFTSFYPMSNTYSGVPILYSNVTYLNSKGAYMSNNAEIAFSQALPQTNTIIINWWEDYNNANGVFGSVFQSVNTVNTNGEGMTYWGNTIAGSGPTGQFGQENIWGFGNATLWPINAGGFTNLVNGSLGNLGTGFSFDHLQRHTTAISADGNGHIVVYEDGCQMGYDANYPNPLSFVLYPTSVMNLMVLGNYFQNNGIPSQFQNGMNGYIESVFTFNTVMTTNLYKATVFASDWLQPHTVRRIWAADSLSTTPYTAVCLPILMNNLAGKEALPINQNQGGTRLTDYGNTTNIINMFPPHGKVTDEINIEGGINDIYGSSIDGPTIYKNMTNIFSSYIGKPGYAIDIWDVEQVWTNNGATTIYQQTFAGLSNSAVFNYMCYTNTVFFRNVYQRSALVTQEMLNTNRIPQLSPDGLHPFNTVNGGQFNWMVVGLAAATRGGVNPNMITNESQNLGTGPISVNTSVNSTYVGNGVPGNAAGVYMQSNSAIYYANVNGVNSGTVNWLPALFIPNASDAFGGGAGALSGVTGTADTAFGVSDMSALTSGGNNDAFGYQALKSVTSGANNEAMGLSALQSLTTGNANVAIGLQNLVFLTTSSGNTAVGQSALKLLGQGSDTGSYVNNTAVGNGAGGNLVSGGDNIYIGSAGVASENFTTRIGIDGTTVNTFLYGKTWMTNGGSVHQFVDIVSNSWTLFSATNGLPNEGLGAKRLIDSNANATVEMQWIGGTTYRSNYLATPGGIAF